VSASLPTWTRGTSADATGKGYQLSHSLIAIGRGEIFGVGLGGSVEKLHWLPEAHTDFLLAVIGEEFGWSACVIVIGLFLWLTRRIMHIGRQAMALDRVFAGLVAQGVGIWMGFQAFINMGVNLGALPTKGLTLPLMSYGGSAILINLDRHRRGAARRLREPPTHARRPRMSRPMQRGAWRLTLGPGDGRWDWGHIFPGLAVAQALRDKGWRVHWLGAPGSMESRSGTRAGFRAGDHRFWRRARQRRADAGAACRCACCAPFGRACRWCAACSPMWLVGLGGYITFPGAMMGVLRQAAGACTSKTRWRGWPTRCLRTVADRVFTAFPGVFSKGAMGGQPVACRVFAAGTGGAALCTAQRAAALVGGRRQLGCARTQHRRCPRRWRCIPEAARPVVTPSKRGEAN